MNRQQLLQMLGQPEIHQHPHVKQAFDMHGALQSPAVRAALGATAGAGLGAAGGYAAGGVGADEDMSDDELAARRLRAALLGGGAGALAGGGLGYFLGGKGSPLPPSNGREPPMPATVTQGGPRGPAGPAGAAAQVVRTPEDFDLPPSPRAPLPLSPPPHAPQSLSSPPREPLMLNQPPPPVGPAQWMDNAGAQLGGKIPALSFFEKLKQLKQRFNSR